jgi:hypothetical protein
VSVFVGVRKRESLGQNGFDFVFNHTLVVKEKHKSSVI